MKRPGTVLNTMIKERFYVTYNDGSIEIVESDTYTMGLMVMEGKIKRAAKAK